MILKGTLFPSVSGPFTRKASIVTAGLLPSMAKWMAILLLLTLAREASGQDEDQATYVARRNAFLQKNFSKFVPVKFEKGTNGLAKIQRVATEGTNTFLWEGHTFCGFQFTAPAWLDGDFEWMFFAAISAAEKGLTVPKLDWYIVAREGTNAGFRYFARDDVRNYPALQREFPYSTHLIRQDLEESRLKPGTDYAIWFCFLPTNNIPDIGFCMTIDSPYGRREAGPLPPPR